MLLTSNNPSSLSNLFLPASDNDAPFSAILTSSFSDNLSSNPRATPSLIPKACDNNLLPTGPSPRIKINAARTCRLVSCGNGPRAPLRHPERISSNNPTNPTHVPTVQDAHTLNPPFTLPSP